MSVAKKVALPVIILLSLSTAPPRGAQARTFVVRTSPQLHRALRAAATNGENDLVRVMPGSYVGNFTYTARPSERGSLTILGGVKSGVGPWGTAYDPTSILRASRSGPILSIVSPGGGRVSITGLTITGGTASSIAWPSLYVSTEARTPRGGGGAITLRYNRIAANESGALGIISRTSSRRRPSSSIRLVGNTIDDNQSAMGAHSSGWRSGSITLLGNRISGNRSGGISLGSYGTHRSGGITLQGNEIASNRNDGISDGIAISTSAPGTDGIAGDLTIRDNTVTDNATSQGTLLQAQTLAFSGIAGGIDFTGNELLRNEGSIVLEPWGGHGAGAVSFNGNTVAGNSGGASITVGPTGSAPTGSIEASGNTISENGGQAGLAILTFQPAARVTLANNFVFGNSGHGILSHSGVAPVEGVSIADNDVTENLDHGLLLTGGFGTLSVTDNTISGNEGGGILCSPVGPLRRLTIAGNSVSQTPRRSIEVALQSGIDAETEVDISDNIVTSSGPDLGLFLDFHNDETPAGRVTLSGNLFSGGDGRGVHLTIRRASRLSFIGNTVSGYSGGGLLYQGREIQEGARFASNRILGNTSGGAGGGAFLDNPDHVVVFANNIVAGNSARLSGGGVYLAGGGDFTVVNNTLAGNSVASQYGAGLCAWSDRLQFFNNIAWGNTGAEDLGLFHTTGVAESWISYHNDAGSIYFGNSELGWTNWGGNFSADPLFTDIETGDFRLEPGSPALDAGDNSAPDLPDTDIDGNPRLQDGDTDGIAVVDLGAFEYSPP